MTVRFKVEFAWKEPLKFRLEYDPKCLKNDLGWDILPSSLYGCIVHAWNRFKLPILITEHGTADAETADDRRKQMILGGVWAIQRAIDEKIDVQGYIHWSLMDNFEWNSGYRARFGLFAVDYRTQRRSLRESGQLFADIIRKWRIANRLPLPNTT